MKIVELETSSTTRKLGWDNLVLSKVLTVILAAFLLAYAGNHAFAEGNASIIEKIRFKTSPQAIRIVFEASNPIECTITTKEGHLNILFPGTAPGEKLSREVVVRDWTIPKIYMKQTSDGVFADVFCQYPLEYKKFKLSNPDRLVIDFDKSFIRTYPVYNISNGVKFYHLLKGEGNSYVTAHVLETDIRRADVFPALARPKNSVIGFFKTRVSDILKRSNACAAINGTYFDVKSGMPLGVLMVGGQLISYPISDRTALVLTKDKKAYIDNIMMDAYFKHGTIKYSITGINQPRTSKNDMILYTPQYGEITKSDGKGFEIAVEDGKVQSVGCGNIWIPKKGFVLSAGPLYAEYLSSSIKNNDPIEVVVNIIPYSSSVAGELLHMIGGGPRLVKSGRIYISKYEENFKRDIAFGHAARTAVGITSDNKLLFVAVDGKPRGGNKKNKNQSSGMTLTELAYFMKSLGAQDALNLDGGGSSVMAVYGKVMNRPVDGSERKISNALLIR